MNFYSAYHPAVRREPLLGVVAEGQCRAACLVGTKRDRSSAGGGLERRRWHHLGQSTEPHRFYRAFLRKFAPQRGEASGTHVYKVTRK